MKKFISISLLFFNIVFGAEKDILNTDNVYSTNDFTIAGSCKPTCRSVKSDYKTKVVDFNPFNGVTKCIITIADIDESNEFNFTADTLNKSCVTNTTKNTPLSNLVSQNKNFNTGISFSFQDRMSFSRQLVGLITLDSDIVDISSTVSQGVLVNKQGSIDSLTSNAAFNSLNKANLGFFVNMFYGFQKVYYYVQYFLFIFVGAFFLTILFWNMAINRIGKTGEKENINKFILPLIMIVFCFIPTQQEGGITTTPIQNIFQYFTQTSNKLADRIVVPGAEAYVKKVYATVGVANTSLEKASLDRLESLKAGITYYKVAHELCKDRFSSHYDDYRNFQTNNEDIIKIAEESNPNGNQDFSFLGCKKIEADLINAEREKIEKELIVNSIRFSGNSTLTTLLSDLKSNISESVNNYGWLYSIYLTSISVVVENLSTIKDSSTQDLLRERNVALENKYHLEKSNDYLTGDEDGGYLGGLSYFILPGAGKVYEEMKRKIETSGSAVASAIGYGVSLIPGVGWLVGAGVAWLGSKASELASPFLAYAAMQMLYDAILKYLPLIVGIVAGIIVVITYLIEILKYFYVAPFIVLYSITKQRQNKIIDFFVDGIGLFLKPLLITVSIFISMFVYYLFIEVFGGLTAMQFEILGSLDKDYFNFINSMTLSVFKTLFHIILSISAAFIIFKIITEGAKMFLNIAGLQDKDNLSSSISHRIDRHTFQV